MKTYKIKSSAVRAAKKEMGDNWAEFASIVPQGEEFVIELKATNQIAPDLAKEIEVTTLITQNEDEIALKASKKAEIEKKKPAFIPAKPIGEPVAIPSAPSPKPSLPAFLKKPSPTQKEVPETKTDADIGKEIERQMAEGDKAANAQTVNEAPTADPLRPRFSTAELPTKKVWHIADSMPGAKRKEVIEACVAAGIAYGTARTQYQHWFKTLNDSKAAPIAVIGADGKVTMPGK